MLPVPNFSVQDCALLSKYKEKENRIAFNAVPAEDAAQLRGIRTRLQTLAKIAAERYGGKIPMTDFVSILNPNGRATDTYWACIYPKQDADEQTNKSFNLQLAIIIMPNGFEVCFCLGAGKSQIGNTDKLALNERQLLSVRAAIANLPVETVARVERGLTPEWYLRKQWMTTPPTQEFSTLTQWLDYAASEQGARASISRYFDPREHESATQELSGIFLEANRIFEPFFEAVYGAPRASRNLSLPITMPAIEVQEQKAPLTEVEPNRDLTAIHHDFASALRECNLVLGTEHDENVRAFLASLAAKRFLILTGLSGSGKTQLAIRFGEWLCGERVRVTPVRPDWTGAEALFGYEDALQPIESGARAWSVPESLEFMIQAANDPHRPYLLVLDEMNLAHVERYFADFLSGMETGRPCLPNLKRHEDGHYRIMQQASPRLPMPPNLFVIGTVNIDETTYLFSPKVLDRANTIEFRVRTSDLRADYEKPQPCRTGIDELTRGFLAIATDERFHLNNPAPGQDEFVEGLRKIHAILAADSLEFGFRVFYEAVRFASAFAAAGNANSTHALDRQIMQKILPRFHGSRRRLEQTLNAFGALCAGTDTSVKNEDPRQFDPLGSIPTPPRLPMSFEKIQRMVRALRANQFTTFTE